MPLPTLIPNPIKFFSGGLSATTATAPSIVTIDSGDNNHDDKNGVDGDGDADKDDFALAPCRRPRTQAHCRTEPLASLSGEHS